MNDLLPSMRQEVRQILLDSGDMYAGNFIEGYGGNIISLDRARSVTSPERKQSETKRTARRQRDQEQRSKMRGSSGGGNPGRQARGQK